MIEVRELRVEFPGHRALDAVSFTLARGSITALVGPNGAGKTTLLRCLAALDEPYAGSIRIAGIDVVDRPRAAHQRLGFLPDHFGLYAELSALRCLQHAGASRGLGGTALKARVQEAAEQVGLAGELHALAGTLSRGQWQRLALAQAIIHKPAVLLLDEPASGLDPEARNGLSGLMRSLAAEGMTLVVSSHILSELEEYCTGLLVLREGRLLEHRVLAGTSAVAGNPLRNLQVRFATAVTREALVAALPVNMQLHAFDGLEAMLQSTATDAQLPALIAALISAGLPVCGFGVVTESLQQAYLDSVQNQP